VLKTTNIQSGKLQCADKDKLYTETILKKHSVISLPNFGKIDRMNHNFLTPSYTSSYFVHIIIIMIINTINTIIITRCSAIAERPRCRVRYSFRQK